jgi:signal transduction histidine kinase
LRKLSLGARLVIFLSFAQIVAFFFAWLTTVGVGLLGVEVFATSLDEVAAIRARKQVVASLTRTAGGEIEIAPTRELQEELKRAPNMKFAAFKSSNLSSIAGSSPQLVSILTPLIEISPTHVHFILPGDPRTIRAGLMEPQATPFGRVHVAVYGQKFRWTDIFDEAQEDLRWMALYLVLVILMSGAAAAVAVRWALRPLKLVARQAERIDMNSLHQRLASEGVFPEILPLVSAINGALERVDAGVARYRRFTANAAHELRTPVMILGARLDAPETANFRVDLRRDWWRIRNIVEQLISSVRIGDQSVRRHESLDLCVVAKEVIADAALLALRTKRQTELEAPQGPVRTSGSKTAIESVIANLVDNAVRAEPEGGAVIVRIHDKGLVEIIDHGDGIEEADREKIFEPFWRKNYSVPGTGLGLAIAKELIEGHGGRIWVDRTPGGGATFKVEFAIVADV